jgi:hypothetical protein
LNRGPGFRGRVFSLLESSSDSRSGSPGSYRKTGSQVFVGGRRFINSARRRLTSPSSTCGNPEADKIFSSNRVGSELESATPEHADQPARGTPSMPARRPEAPRSRKINKTDGGLSSPQSRAHAFRGPHAPQVPVAEVTPAAGSQAPPRPIVSPIAWTAIVTCPVRRLIAPDPAQVSVTSQITTFLGVTRRAHLALGGGALALRRRIGHR